MITDKKAKSITPKGKAIPTGIIGLTLQPTNTKGRGKWIFRFVSPVTGKRRQASFGIYPEVTVSSALQQGRGARELLAAGDDPLVIKRQKSAIPTFEQATRDYWARLRPTLKPSRQRDKWIRLMELHAFPHIGARRVDSLTPQDFAAMLSPIWTKTPETARKAKQRSGKVMGACWARGQTQGNPVDVVHMILPKQNDVSVHQPSMPWQMVPEFVKQYLSQHPLQGCNAALLFTILTAARSEEVRGATWDEIDLDKKLWTIPPQRMKTPAEHRVPLSDASVSLLADQRSDCLLFPAIRGGQMSDMALTSLLRRVNATSDVAGRVATAHGFRSSFRNWAADHGYQHDIAERALAHIISNKVQAAYERTDRLSARIGMMQQWADHVTSVSSNVPEAKSENKR